MSNNSQNIHSVGTEPVFENMCQSYQILWPRKKSKAYNILK